MKRREFIARSAQVAVVIAARPVLSMLQPAPLVAIDPLTGISIRMVRQWEPYIQTAVSAMWDEHDRQFTKLLIQSC